MKALISPYESFTWTWVTSWKRDLNSIDSNPQGWIPDTTDSIENCQRIAEVGEAPFDVAFPLHWVDCPNDCKADQWYFKDGVCNLKPQDVPIPE